MIAYSAPTSVEWEALRMGAAVAERARNETITAEAYMVAKTEWKMD